MAVEDILRYGFDKFDNNEYDEAIMAFMAAHQASSDKQMKNDIFQVVNENFIAPNEGEFRKAYEENCKLLRENEKLHLANIPQYEELSLKMIPVSDSRFYVWNDEEKRFEGKQPVIVEENLQDVKTRMFSPILIDGYSDIRGIIHNEEQSRNMRVYLVLGNDRLVRQLFSYFIIPGMAEKLIELNVDIFEDKQAFKEYLIRSGAYIPREIKSDDLDEYTQMMSEIHAERIRENRKGGNVFLSICIPSFNRGKEALETIKNLQQLMYDEEIEIILCNNSSTKGVEYYEKIRELSGKDKRIIYKEMQSGCYRDSFENVIGLPTGKHALLSTDQDHIIIENLDNALQYIYDNCELGLISFETKSTVSKTIYYNREKSTIYADTFEKIYHACGSNYLTGLCFNMEAIRENDLCEKLINKYHNEDNLMYNDYTHCVFAAYLVKNSAYAFSAMLLFTDEAEEENLFDDNGGFKLQYIFPESRMKRIRNEIAILMDLELYSWDFTSCLLNAFLDVYRLLRIGYKFYFEEMIKKHSWDDTCDYVYKEQLDIINNEKVMQHVGNDYYRKQIDVQIEERYLKEIADKPYVLKN